jgi:glutamate:Na+ symporter, ESS family
MTLKLDMVQTAALAVVVLLIGQQIKNKVTVLDKYCIPSPVVGGLLFAIIALFLRTSGVLMFEMTTTLQTLFMTAFFTTVGFTASFKLLKKGGIQVVFFLIAAVILVIFQDIVGVTLAKVFGLNPLIGLATGSVPMTGGHGTSGAFGPELVKAGAEGATTVALASATFGLVMGSMIGGPLAKRLIEKYNLKPGTSSKGSGVQEAAATTETAGKLLNNDDMLLGAIQILIAMGAGTIISSLLQKTGMTFPAYIGGMFAAAIMRNLSDSTPLFKLREQEIDAIGNISLSIFLSMALMTLKLWELAALAVPMVVMLLAQTILMLFFAYFVTFRLMGKDYDAAVMASGHCGFGMGATPNAMANMDATSKKYGPAPRAFFIIPIVGSLFIDFFNAGIITAFINMFK